jgi:hypothetical protein
MLLAAGLPNMAPQTQPPSFFRYLPFSPDEEINALTYDTHSHTKLRLPMPQEQSTWGNRKDASQSHTPKSKLNSPSTVVAILVIRFKVKLSLTSVEVLKQTEFLDLPDSHYKIADSKAPLPSDPPTSAHEHLLHLRSGAVALSNLWSGQSGLLPQVSNHIQ